MPCDCAKYQPIELDRKSISRRIKESAAIRERLVQLAENAELHIALFRCRECGQQWQSGREWNFKFAEYFFHVPAIEVAEWEREPYRQPAAMMIYAALMEPFFKTANFTPRDVPCRTPECGEPAIAMSVFCKWHHVESLQRLGHLPKEPVGRMFPPYHYGKTDGE